MSGEDNGLKPLDLCVTRSFVRTLCCLSAWLLIGIVFLTLPSTAQDTKDSTKDTNANPGLAQATPPTVAPQMAIKFRERPRYVTDPQRLKRTPPIDGSMADGEWDPFYTIDDGPIKGTVYCNWDDNNLYLAAKTDGPATVLFDVDMSDDGWLRGADNLELVIGSPVAEGGA